MQQEVMQQYRRHRHLVLLSPTGSGKTLAYLLPLVSQLDASVEQLQAVVLVPSRELAVQTSDILKQLCPDCRCMACYGGRAAMEEHKTIRGLRPHVVIATPGRMMDHLQKENLLPEHVRTLVIDEFDKSLEMGFQQQMSSIMDMLPNVERFILLSATDNPNIPSFVGEDDFYKIDYSVDPSEDLDRISMFEVLSPVKDKLQTLLDLLCTLGDETSIVFVNYRESVERVGRFLIDNSVSVAMYHGNMEQRDREKTIYRFANGSCRVLVSTDLAARGLDIDDVDNVIHYHLPLDEKAYIHRNGRTARWDAHGHSYMILGPEEYRPEYVSSEPERFKMPTRIPAPMPARWATLYIGKGKKDKINKIDVVGFLSKVGGLTREQIGRVDVLPGWGYAAVARAEMPHLLKRIRGQKIKGIKTIFALAE
ncbi:MAG: DEAD/DEAH box helicase [Bacteroidaceae bacterium]|nr:DEAD/DEAH box helicase [Bacteroidaceae bacterium]